MGGLLSDPSAADSRHPDSSDMTHISLSIATLHDKDSKQDSDISATTMSQKYEKIFAPTTLELNLGILLELRRIGAQERDKGCIFHNLQAASEKSVVDG